MEKALDSGIRYIECGTALSFERRGNASAEITDGRRKPAPPRKQLEKVATRRELRGTRDAGVFVKVSSKTVAMKALPWGQEPLVRESRVSVGDVLIPWNVPGMIAVA